MEESIIESKIAERICISKEYANEQYESEKIKLIRKSINDIFEDLYLELENCWEREVLSFRNGDLIYYPGMNVMLERKKVQKFMLGKLGINLSGDIQLELLTEIGEKFKSLFYNEVKEIFSDYSFKIENNITKLELALKYQIDISELKGKCAQIYVQLGELQRNKYIVIEHGKISLTKEGEKAVVSGKIKGININDISEKAQKNNSLNVKNVSLKGKSVEEKKLYLADYLKCDKYRANIGEYDLKRLEDPNMGHWELWEGNEMPNVVSVSAEDRVIARNPAADIQEDSIVGIDFGTKSTVVVYQDRSGNIKP